MKFLSPFFITSIFLFCFIENLTAQKNTETFSFENTLSPAQNTYFSNFSLIDMRDDTSSIGIIQKGAFNRKTALICEPQLDIQLNKIFKELAGGNNNDTELILLLQHLNFSEVTYAMKEIGLLQIRGVFFAKRNNKYSKLFEVDTVQTVQSMDVTKQLLKKGNAFFIDLFNTAINSQPKQFDLDDLSYLINYDSLQKINLPLYTVSNYKNGAYATYEEFAKQTPTDTTLKIQFYKSGHWKSVQIKNKKDKYEEVVLKDWYAYVFENKIFLSTAVHEVYPVEKKGNDFYFKGKAWVPASAAQSITMGLAFGILGALAASAGNMETTELKIDYKTGGFVRVSHTTK